MSIVTEQQILTPEEYLESEKLKSKEESKAEYFDGEIYDKPSASEPHETIGSNLLGHFWSTLRKEGCKTYKSDLRVKLSPTKYVLPDVVVVKGQPELSPGEFDNLLNPHLIVEVLSDSTEKKDRGIKANAYRKMESLQEYVLVSQYDYLVESFHRNEAGGWAIGDTLIAPDEVLKFHSVPLKISVKDIYEGVVLKGEERVKDEG